MIQTWITDVNPLLEKSTYALYYSQAPDFRQEKADRLSREQDRALSIGAWTLYEVMKEEFELSEKAAFNLSHSGCYAICAIDDTQAAETKVGCDIESVGKNHDRIAKHFFTGKEYDYIIGHEEEQDRTEAFTRIWVLKESFVKATRKGLSLGLKNFEVDFDGQGSPYISRMPKAMVGQFYFQEYRCPVSEYKAAVCATTPSFAEDMSFRPVTSLRAEERKR